MTRKIVFVFQRLAEKAADKNWWSLHNFSRTRVLVRELDGVFYHASRRESKENVNVFLVIAYLAW